MQAVDIHSEADFTAERPNLFPPGWPEPEGLQDTLPPVKSFSEDLLPDSFRAFVADVAERMQVPMDFPAVAAVLCLAGAVNRRAVVQPKANDTGWVVVPNLWGGIVAPPGYLKSPVIHSITNPLTRIQDQWRITHEEAMKSFERKMEEHTLRVNAWKQQFTQNAKKSKGSAPARPEDEPEEPKLRRLIVNDATFESLHEIMRDNPAGVFVIRDELAGWWSQLDKHGREGERAFFLQSWNGDSSHTIDRIGRGADIHVEACCTSMVGGIQPGRLRSYLTDALEDGPDNDGLVQRFQVLVWPDAPEKWTYTDRPPERESEERAAAIFRHLVDIDPARPLQFRFAPDAQEFFIGWLSTLEGKVRGKELHPALISHLSKYRSLMPSLALLFELADRVGFVGFDGSVSGKTQNIVGLEHATQAAQWCTYLESHAHRIYSCAVAPQMQTARELADKIKTRKVGKDGSFAVRDVYIRGWKGLDTPDAVKAAAEILTDAGWLREVPSESKPSGGRPSKRYEVNPRITTVQ